MFVSIVYIIYGLIQVALLVMAYRMWRENNRLYLAFLCAVILGLAYDNLVIGFGRFIGAGSLLQTLNFPRYLIHALFTPTMMIVGLNLARNAGIRWAWGKTGTAIFVTLTALMIALGVYLDVIRLKLETAFDNGTIRYANANAEGPPIPAIITIIVLIVCGVAVFLRHRWASWLLIGSILMFLTSAAGSALGFVTNIGEIALTAGMVLTARRFVPVDGLESAEAAFATSPS